MLHRRIGLGMATAVLLGGMLLTTVGCGKGGGSSSPAAPTGTGGVSGTLYQDNNVQLASAGLMERVWVALAREADALVRVTMAHAAVQLDLSNTSPSSGVLVELLLNGGVIASATTGPNGKFEFGGIGGGEYVLRFSKGTDLLVETDVNVVDGALTEVEGKITLASSGNVHIKVEVEKSREVDHYFEHEIKESESQDPNKVEIKGTVVSVSPLVVNSNGVLYNVNTDGNTKFEGIIAEGVFVEVEGVLTGTDILAYEVEVEEDKTAKKDKDKDKDKEKDKDKDKDDDKDDDKDNDDDDPEHIT